MMVVGLSGQRYNLEPKPFKSGGEGDIYCIFSMPDKCAKIYHSDHITKELETKLTIMVRQPPSISVLSQVAWPLDVIFDVSRSFVGFVMPKLDITEELIELYKYPPQKYKNVTTQQKLIVAENICAVISKVHKAGYVFGDFNPRNIGINLKTGKVAFLDTDSYHIYDRQSGNTYRCKVCLDGYVAPELIAKCKPYKKDAYAVAPLPTFTQETDNFSLAVHIFKLLMNGFTPFNGIKETDSASTASPGVGNVAVERDNYCFKPGNKPLAAAVPPLETLSDEIADLFTRAFMYGKIDPKKRPTAAEWHKALLNYERCLKTCSSNSAHQYKSTLKSCPWCEADIRYAASIAPNIQQRTFVTPVTPVTSPQTSTGGNISTAVRGQSGTGNKYSPPVNYGAAGTMGSTYTAPVKAQKRTSFLKVLVFAAIIVVLFIAVVKSCSSGSRSLDYTLSTQSTQGNSTSNSYDNGNITSSINVTETAKPLRELSVSEIQRDTLDIEGIYVGNTLTISEEPVVTFSGSVSQDNNRQTYSYTAPREGRYRLDLTNVSADASIRLMMWDASGNNITDTNSNGAYVNLNANETYEIQIRYYSGESGYTLEIGVQKPTTDISLATTINDQISFEDQKNVYTFTAPIDGRYRFDLTEVNANTSLRLMMWDQLENNIMDTTSGGGYVSLNAGETYQIQVRQYSELGSYTLVVGFQKATQDISDYGIINDSIQYEDQRNVYTFTAPIDGRYRFDLTEVNANTSLRLMMWDQLENNIMDTTSGGGYVSLNAGETYQIQVRQYSDYGSYKMVIGYQKKSEDISNYDVVKDNITFEDQRNIYYFTPTQSREYTFSINGVSSPCTFRLIIWDRYENSIMDTNNEVGVVLLEAGETYTIQVRQYSGQGSYSLAID